MRHSSWIAIFATIILGFSCGSRGYRIDIAVNGASPGDTIILSGFDGYKFVPLDSLWIPQNKSQVTFQGDSLLPAGLYIISCNKEDLFEFILSGPSDQYFLAKTDLNGTVQFEGSEENCLNAEFQRQIAFIRNRLPAGQPSPEIDAALIKLQQTTVNKTKGTLLSSLIRSQMTVSMPLYLTGKEQQEHYRTEHMWDSFDFSDARLIRTPLLYRQLQRFVQTLSDMDEGDQTRLIHQLLDRTSPQNIPEVMRRYVPSTLFTLYDDKESPYASDSMVLLTGEYLLSRGLHNGLADSLRIRFAMENAHKNREGHIATDFTLLDAQGQEVSLHQVKARYTLLYFFDPDCNVCKQVTEAVEFLKKKYSPNGLQVVSVYTESETDKWFAYLHSGKLAGCINLYDPSGTNEIRDQYDLFGMPILYLLDAHKRIIMKNIPPMDPVTPIFYYMNRDNK